MKKYKVTIRAEMEAETEGEALKEFVEIVRRGWFEEGDVEVKEIEKA